MATTPSESSGDNTLHVVVMNGDLSFVAEPLLVGHYASSRLTGTESVLNRRLGGAMQQALDLGLYPVQPREYHVFDNERPDDADPLRLARPRAVIVLGLGQEGSLTGKALAETVRQGVLGWIHREVERSKAAKSLRLAATLMGTGGIGVRVGEAAQMIVQGVIDANESLQPTDWPRVTHLRLIELYRDRATEAWRALRQLDGASGALHVGDALQQGRGFLERPIDAGYRGADYDMVSAAVSQEADGTATIAYTLSTRRARSEVRGKATQVALVRRLVEVASNHLEQKTDIRQALFNLLVPIELEPLLADATGLQLEVSKETASIPWEMLELRERGREAPPWAIRTRLIRKYRTANFRPHVVHRDNDGGVLVIGNPPTGLAEYPSLDEARLEAIEVAACFQEPDGDPVHVERLINPDDEPAWPPGERVITTLLSRDWRIVHITAHGHNPPMLASDGPAGELLTRSPSRGIVLSHGLFLGPSEFGSMRIVPELVFLNGCHLSRQATGDLLAAPGGSLPNRAELAASVATALIEMGVRCVIAAGWAVFDDSARTFATVFYRELLRGRRFVDAVSAARRETAKLEGNTWAAYQCYGDPDWTFRAGQADAQQPASEVEAEFATIGSPSALRLLLHTIGTNSAHHGFDKAMQRAKLERVETQFAGRWGSLGAVAEAFGDAWSDSGDLARAIAWYDRAHAAADGAASFRAVEQLANLEVRSAWEHVRNALDKEEAPPARTAAKKPARKRTQAAAAADNVSTRRLHVIANARETLQRAIGRLEGVSSFGRTMERESLLGSAFKRLALLESAAGNETQWSAAMARMVSHYRAAVDICTADGGQGVHYPSMNGLAAEVALNAGTSEWRGLDRNVVDLTKTSLAMANAADADFWSRSGEIELAMLLGVAERRLPDALKSLLDAFADLHGRVPSVRYWRSVYDQARFVLDPFLSRASADEQAAVKAIFQQLGEYSA